MKHEITSLNTKKTIAASLKKAMEKKTFSKITVSEIIADCGVNRKTFYYHFQDIYDLLKWMLEEEAIEVVKSFDLLVDYEEAIAFVMDYVEKNSHILNCAFDSIGRDELKRFFNADFIDLMKSIIDEAEQKGGISLEPEYKDFLSQFYTEAVTGMLVDWIRNRDNISRENVSKYISDTIKSSIYGIFRHNGMPESMTDAFFETLQSEDKLK